MSEILNGLRKKTGSMASNKCDFTKYTGFFDTGFPAINRVITGNIKNGFPEGRVSTLYGESQSGKSMIVSNVIVDALNNKGYDEVFYVDSEGGGLWNFLDSKKVDRSKIEYVPVASVEECSVALLNIYSMLEEALKDYEKNPEENKKIKALVILDSFGALGADKVMNDAVKKEQMVQDMGTTARLKNNMISTLMMRVVRTNCALLVTNHVYDNPGAMFTSKVKDMPGGKKLYFASDVILQSSKRLIKEGDVDYVGIADGADGADNGYFKGNVLKFFCIKNRVIKPGYEAQVYMDFNAGHGKWDGLVEDAVKFGFIEENRGKYIVKSYSDKPMTFKALLSCDEAWNSFIDEFNKKSIDKMSYSNMTTQEVDKILAGADEPSSEAASSAEVPENPEK